MANIPLRDYLTGIEELVDNGQTDEALAHCRHILESFPKHVETYRMMAKAYVESHQHNEAADLFQRVLSSSPDDFVAHIGMSIIHEERGDQDRAIWHMERAFEGQPSNRAVQDELRRLYGKREGYAPPKVRLTRGALARMYAHGGLYNQAIGELRGALTEDPQRPDLQVLLAEMYFKTNQQAEAIEVCSKLIEKIPYCLNANRLMAHILRSNDREVEAKPYLDRVAELDPYAAFVDSQTPSSGVAADSVTIEQLVPEGPTPTGVPLPKAWTASLQAQDLSAGPKEELPDWLSFDDEEEEPAQAEPSDTKPSMLDNLESLEPVAPPAEEAAAEVEPVVPPFNKTPTAALADDQVPDWLRELGPATGTLPPLADEPEDVLPKRWTDDLKGSEPQETEPSAEAPEAMPIAQIEPAPAPSREDEDSLGWLENLAAEQGAAEDELITSPEEREGIKPDWAPAEQPESAGPDPLAWLDEMEKEKVAAADAPEGAAEPVAPKAAPTPAAVNPEPPVETTTPTWLRDLSAEIEQKVDPQPVEPRGMEEAPDWLSDLRREGDADTQADQPDASELEETTPPDSGELGKLDWLEEPVQPKSETRESAWVPETELAAAPLPPPAATRPLAEPALSPRRTARLQSVENAEAWLEQARQALNFGKLADASQHYGQLLRRRLLLPEVIADLEAAVHRNTGNPTLWQTLGDAYMRNNQLRQALECYTRAEEAL
ncbi:MAG: tetratricopeptide repeat protein [Anaerolineales bacterium]